MKRRFILSFLAVAIGVGALAFVLWRKPVPQPQAIQRSELQLRDGRLYRVGAKEPFTGLLFEPYDNTRRKVEIEIVRGKAHGISRGWFESGQMEVEEHFVGGVSSGPRRRWHPNGVLKSEETIVDGTLSGPYTEWYDNGVKAMAAGMRAGKPHGIAEAWHRSGAPKSRTRLEDGKIVDQQFFAETVAAAGSQGS